MGKPMRSRILTIALALSLLATAFVAFPTTAAYDYTGSVATTNDTGAPKYVYIQGEQVYVNVEVRYHGELSPEEIRVRLQPANMGWTSQFTVIADDPVDGWYNSSVALSSLTLSTMGFWLDEEIVCYVIAYERWTMTELDRTTILVKEAGFSVDPDPIFVSGIGTVGYYPGQTLDITMITSRTTEMFYVQIVNETGTTVQNWTAQIAPAGYWHATWTIPTTLANGEYTIMVRDSTTHLPWPYPYVHDFDVRSFVFDVIPERDSYLLGEVARMQVITIDLATLGPAVGVTVSFSAHWYNASDGDQWLNSTLVDSMGVHELQIPASDVATWWGIEIDYSATLSGRAEEAYVWLDFAQISATVYTNWGGYMPGDVVALTVEAEIDGYPLPDAAVDIKVSKNGTKLDAYSVSGLMTDLDGIITYAFKLSPDAAIGTYSVEVTVSKVGSSTIAATSFYVSEYGSLVIRFDKDYYISGETMFINFEAYWQGLQVYLDSMLVTVTTDWGLLAIGNTSTMAVSAQLPTDYVGDVWVYATGYYGDMVFNTVGWTEVFGVRIVILPNTDTFEPGDTLTFTWNVIGPVSNGTLNYILYGSNVYIESASPAFAMTGTVTFEVPLTDPDYVYGVWISLLTDTGSYSESQAEADITDDGELSIWVEKSKYADGAFKPGQTVKIQYEIFNFWSDPLPMYLLVVSCDYDPAESYIFVTAASGVVEYTLPADLSTGMLEIEVELWDPTDWVDLSDDSTTVMVNNRLSAWDTSIGGMAASDFLIMLLIVVMIIVLIVMPFIKGRQPKTEAPVVEEPLPPPAEPPKT
jgi:hypothetical protein